MSTKLTLSMDDETILLAKELAALENKSLSSMVREMIFERLESSKKLQALQSFEKMRGIVNANHLSDEDLEEIRLKHLKKKHGL